MNFNNILEVPTQDQIEGFYGEEVLRGSFQSVEGSGGGRIECKCCKSQLSSLAKRPDLKKHLLTHALLVKDERIKHFERSQTEPDKLVCTFCRGEYKFQHAFRHLQSCKKKNGTGSAGRKNVRRVFGERNVHGCEDGSLLNKRTHEEHAEAYCGEDKVEPDDEAEEEEKLEKKVKTEKLEKAVFSSLNGREGSSFAKKMYDFMVANKGLEKRALQLKIKEFVEPLQEQWEEERKIWESEIEKVRAEQRLDNQEKNKKIEELQRQIEKIEDEKKELEKAIKESEIAIKKEMESEIDQRIETNNAVMQTEIRRQVEECLKNMGLQAGGYGYDYDDAM